MKIYQFKAKDSEIKPYPLSFGMATWKKTGLNIYVYGFSADYHTIDVSEIVDIHKYLMKQHNINCSR